MSIRYVQLSAPQDSVMGVALNNLYYGNDDLLGLIETSGYPHNGGYHILTIRGNEETVLTWLELFLHTYPTTLAEINALKNEVIKSDKRVIKLIDLKRRGPQGKKQKWYCIAGLEFFRRFGDARIEGVQLAAIPLDCVSIVCPRHNKAYLETLLTHAIKGNYQ